MNMIGGQFTIDDENFYKGYFDNSVRWNGWYVPYFDFHTAIDILNDMDLDWDYNGKFLVFDEDGTCVEYAPVFINFMNNMIRVYSIGGFYWVWDK